MEMHKIAGGTDMGSWFCPDCLRVICIILEPGKSRKEVKEIDTMSGKPEVQYCPFCDGIVEREDS